MEKRLTSKDINRIIQEEAKIVLEEERQKILDRVQKRLKKDRK